MLRLSVFKFLIEVPRIIGEQGSGAKWVIAGTNSHSREVNRARRNVLSKKFKHALE